MTVYLGLKLINAKPMTRQAYNDFRGWELPSDENGDDEGFLVEYVNGGKANTKEYEGYVSWSPKEVFEKAYSPVFDVKLKDFTVDQLEDWQYRVYEEYQELVLKISKLRDYLYKTNFTDELLTKQFNYMRGYMLTLADRMNGFGLKEKKQC